MTHRCIASLAAIALSLTLVLLVERPAAAQSTSSTNAQAPRASTIPRMSDGHPSFAGKWNDKTLTPFERPKDLGSKEFYTDEEFTSMNAMLKKIGRANV